LNLSEGVEVHFEASNRSNIEFRVRSVSDATTDKKTGGLFLKSASEAVVRLIPSNANQELTIDNVIVDLPERGIMAMDSTTFLHLKTLRGWDGKSGTLYCKSLWSLKIDSYNDSTYTERSTTADGKHADIIHKSNMFLVDHIFAPNMAMVSTKYLQVPSNLSFRTFELKPD
jgi:hypothetical protein